MRTDRNSLLKHPQVLCLKGACPFSGVTPRAAFWEVGGIRSETSSKYYGSKNLSRAPIYRYMRETQRGYGFIEFEISNSTTSTVFRQPLTFLHPVPYFNIFQQYSAVEYTLFHTHLHLILTYIHPVRILVSTVFRSSQGVVHDMSASSWACGLGRVIFYDVIHSMIYYIISCYATL